MKCSDLICYLSEEFRDLALHGRDQRIVAMHALAPVAHVLGHARVKADVIAPLAPGAGHLPEHLRRVLARHGAGEQGFDVGACVRRFDFQKAVITDQAIWGCVAAMNARVLDESDLHHVGIRVERIRVAGLRLGFNSPAHFGALVSIGRYACESFCDQLSGIVRARCAPTALGARHNVADSRCAHAAAAGNGPLIATLD